MTDTTPPLSAHRPGPGAWVRLTCVEAKLVARDTGSLIVPLGLPLLLLVMNGLGSDRRPVAELGGLPPLEALIVPLTLVMVVALIGIVNMPSFLTFYRTTGVLRRLAVTPAHPAMLLVAQVVVSLVQTTVGVGAALAVAAVAFDLAAPASVGWAVASLAATAAAMYALGMLVAAIAPTTNAAVAIGLLLFFTQLALGGGLGGRDALPDWLATVGAHLPYGAGVDALGASWAGQAPDVAHLVALAAVAVVGGVLAARLFRWE